ncbi:S-adenosyl-L-methionine-dependent methyltransferase [Cantharellus anzutake]|uniref:S-adenosyl-L-methionine-dependent methyltransferase n=1 Tax=Cantharellus anzutake TaxID=1750568 RepID=UPI001905DB28|nr:S-adenosyl-L-methionine-dependent methyltransferase [Cantharellus anzutake]KAF8336530.1 S-adenosyl-L-methionine-dependent methyltransferase [Cantharellus anzutake]
MLTLWLANLPVFYIDCFSMMDLEGQPLEVERLFAPEGRALISGSQTPFCGDVSNEAEQYPQDRNENSREDVERILVNDAQIQPYDIGTDRLFWLECEDRWLILLNPVAEQESLHGNFLLMHRLIQVMVNAAFMDPCLEFHHLPDVILRSQDWHIMPPLESCEENLTLTAQIIPNHLAAYLHTLIPSAKKHLEGCPLIKYYTALCDEGVPPHRGNLHTPHQLCRSLKACAPRVLRVVAKGFPYELWNQLACQREKPVSEAVDQNIMLQDWLQEVESSVSDVAGSYQSGDYILLKPDGNFPPTSLESQNPYARLWFGKIISINLSSLMCHVQWFCHSSTVPIGELGHTQELFETLQCDNKPLSLIRGRISLKFVPPGEDPPDLANPDYFCRFVWDNTQGCFFDHYPWPGLGHSLDDSLGCLACEAERQRVYLKDTYQVPSNHLFSAEEILGAIPELRDLGYSLGVLDLFSGAGGFSGFQQTGILDVKAAIENSELTAGTFSLNYPSAWMFCADTEEVLRDFFQHNADLRFPHTGIGHSLHQANIPVLCAGFPCQPFSFANRNKKILDPRSILVANVLSWVEALRPSYVVLENVLGVIHHQFPEGEKHIIVKFLSCALVELGYQMRMGILQSAAFGVPQTRERFIVIAAQSGLTLPNLPAPTHQFTCRATTLNIGHLKLVTSKNDVMHAQYPPVSLKSVLEDALETKYYGNWPELAETIRTRPQHHPVEDRFWDIMEEKIIQGFSKDYEMGTNLISEQRKMIGNAVPPPLAKAIGFEIIKAHLVDLRRQAEAQTYPIWMEDYVRQHSRLG